MTIPSRKLGTADDHEAARWIAGECYHQISLLLSAFAREMGGWDKLPAALVISDADPKGWHGCEASVDRAVQRGDWPETWTLCAAYKARVGRYLAVWRERIKRKQVVI